MELEEEMLKIDNYISKAYGTKHSMEKNFCNLYQINIKNKDLYPYSNCSMYLGICPAYGFAPEKILLHYERISKQQTGVSNAIIYEGLNSVDWIMNEEFNIKKEQEQISLF